MNERSETIRLRDIMDDEEGWGRAQGRKVYQRLLESVEAHPGTRVFRVSLRGVRRLDISFASETVVELARRFRGLKGFCLTDLSDPDLIENLDAAAAKKAQPLILWTGKDARVIGVEPSEGNRDAFQFVLARASARVAEYVNERAGVSITGASNKFKQLWQQGFLLRREGIAESGGVEFVYHRIG